MRWSLALLLFLLPALLVSVTGCACLNIFIEFEIRVTRDGNRLEQSEVVKPGDKLQLRTNGSFMDGSRDPISGCSREVKVTRVRYFNGTTQIGSSEQEPFSIDWTPQAGKDGLPESGSGQIVLSAKAQTGFISNLLILKFEP